MSHTDITHPSESEYGQALIETIFILSTCAGLLLGLQHISHILKQSHQALIHSRRLAFQAAYHPNNPDTRNAPGITRISPPQYIGDTLPRDDIMAALVITKNNGIIATYPPEQTQNTHSHPFIVRKTVLGIDTYATQQTDHISAQFFPTLFPSSALDITLLNKVMSQTNINPLPLPNLGEVTLNKKQNFYPRLHTYTQQEPQNNRIEFDNHALWESSTNSLYEGTKK